MLDFLCDELDGYVRPFATRQKSQPSIWGKRSFQLLHIGETCRWGRCYRSVASPTAISASCCVCGSSFAFCSLRLCSLGCPGTLHMHAVSSCIFTFSSLLYLDLLRFSSHAGVLVSSPLSVHLSIGLSICLNAYLSIFLSLFYSVLILPVFWIYSILFQYSLLFWLSNIHTSSTLNLDRPRCLERSCFCFTSSDSKYRLPPWMDDRMR